MNRFPLANLVALLASLSVGSAVAAAGTKPESKDDRAIRALQVRQAEAWNSHDSAAYAALFTKEGDVVNVLGWWWHGRAEITSKLNAAFAFVFRDSTLTITDVAIDYPKRDLAVAHVRWTMSGARTPPGMAEPRAGIELQVLKREAGRWLITSFQNTNSIPEFPFPAGPPK